MATCPNKNLDSWKNLVTARGEDVAYYLWDAYEGNVPEGESRESVVKSGLKATSILQSPKADQFFNSVAKNKISGEFFWKKMQADLGIPKDQIELLKQYNTTDRDELITNMLANYSYTIEINIAKDKVIEGGYISTLGSKVSSMENRYGKYYYTDERGVEIQIDKTSWETAKQIFDEFQKGNNVGVPTQYYSNLTVPGGTNYVENEIATPAITPSIKGHAQFATDQGIGWFRSDDELASKNLSDDLIITEEDGVFFTSYQREGSGLVEFVEGSSEQEVREKYSKLTDIKKEKSTIVGDTSNLKTRRILEVQSDLFQKGRDSKKLNKQNTPKYNKGDIITNDKGKFEFLGYFADPNDGQEYVKLKNIITGEEGTVYQDKFDKRVTPKDDLKANEFLQLLNQGSNWITFFVKSIIQDSSKKGYEKVLFPTGDTASKVEGHSTLEEFKKEKEDRIKQLESSIKERNNKKDNIIPSEYFNINMYNSLSQIEQKELIQKEKIKLEQEVNNFNNEINQLKQELERVDREGFGALKPIFNFYENTVTNILNKQYGKENVKQITDEYGNTWNEIEIVPEREQQPVLLQTEDMPASKISKETLDKIMKVAKDMGVSVIELSAYLKGNPNVDARGVNGVADLVKGVIAIAQGRESVATTEELVHVATAILEQTNPALITSLISRIGEYKIYKQTLETYGKRKEYQLPNGKPDIRKIKKEAVDKLIAEYIVLRSEGSTEFPELRDKEKRNVVQRMWDTILEAIKSLYGKSKVDLFQETAAKILEGDVGGTVADITQGGVFFQVEKNELVDNVYNTIQMEASKIVGPIPATYDASGKLIKKRHYLYDGKEVDFSVTEKLKEDSGMPERSELNKLEDDQKRLWGSEGHSYIENFIAANLIDKDGYKTKEVGKTTISTKLNDTIKEKLETFAKSLIASYPEGTRFLLEKKVVNMKGKETLASTIDFIAIQPVVKKNGEKDVKVDVLDWKFSSINKAVTEDVPWFKRKEWRAQMGEYVKIMYNYGIKANQLGRTRMIQFISNYTYAIYGDRKSPLNLTSIEVGNLDNAKETTLYLLPVPIISETTGNPVIDEFVKSLERQWDKLYAKYASPEEKFAKNIELDQLSKAIRHLHLKLEFEPLVGVGTTFLNNAAKAFKVFETIDYSTLTEEELRVKLRELYEYKNSAVKFSQLDDIFLSKFPTKNLSEADKKTLKSLEHIASSTGRMLDKIKEIENQFAVQTSLKEGFTTEEGEKEGNEELGQSILTAERALDTASRTFLEGSKLSSKIINLAANLIMNAASLVNLKVNRRIKDYADLLIPLEKEARAIGKNAFDMIGKVAGGKLELIKKIDSKFLEAVEEAKESGDKKFLVDNMNLSEYMRLAEEAIKKGEEQINNTTFSTDEEKNLLDREYRINKLKDELDITRLTFNGYKAYQFAALFGKTMKEEDHLSSDYKNMSRSTAALEMWKFMTALNEKAISMGYLANRGISFFPLVEASLIEKVSNSGDVLKEGKDFFGDMFTTKVDEEQKYSKRDPETNQIRKKIPTYFTRTNKEVTQISRDMTKIGPLWIKALMQYEAARDLEYTLLTLNSVEKNKGTVIVDENQNIVMEAGVPKVDKSTNKNANLLETIIDDFLYQLGENLDSFGNIKIGQLSDKLKKDDESKERTKVSIKKGLESSNKLVQSLAVGLSPLVSIANYVGYNFHAFITAGNMMRFREFAKNNGAVTTGVGMTTLDIGLLDLIVPLNEDISKEKMREISLKQGYMKFLSTWTFTDVMMVTNSFPEKRLQLATAKTLNENSMVVDGKIVNIRQYVKAQDRGRYKTMAQAERLAFEKTYEERVAKLKSEKSLDKIAKIENDRVVIPGVSDIELAKYRTSVVEYVRTLNGQMSADNKADYRRDTMFRSFMMFKNWIPKLVSQRTSDIKKNKELDQWEYGRGRLFLKTWSHLGLTSIFKMRQIIQGTDEGLAILDEMLKQKKEDYYRKNGKVLEITNEEFYDLVRTELNNEMKELGILFGTIALMIAAKMAIPPEEEEDPLIRNRYKYILKGVNKITDEIGFYYNPLSTEAITRGSIIPALGLLSKSEKIIEHILREGYGRITDNEDIIEKAHPTKYFVNVIPGAYQFQRDVLPLVNPELAKELGVRVTVESRRQ